MSQLTFGNLPADMGDQWFGFGAYDSGEFDYVIVAATSSEILLRDPVTLATVRFTGQFDTSTIEAAMISPLDGIEWRDAAGALLFQWTALGTTIGQVLSIETDPNFAALTLRLADAITGGQAADLLSSFDGDDTVAGGGGNDTIDAGAGTDVVAFSGLAANYQLAYASGGWTVTDLVGGDGVDSVANAEQLQFADRTVVTESHSHGSYADLPESLWHFFIVAFDAAPGVVYMDQLAEAYRWGLSVKEIVDIFTTKHQFTDVYPASLNHHDLAVAMVANIVKQSASDAAKLEAIGDIEAALDIGWTPGDVVYRVFGNLAAKPLTDATWGNTAGQFANQIAVAKCYTEVMNQGTTDLDTLRAVIEPVTPLTDVSSDSVMITLIGQALLES